jgi:hypothetical protein
VLEQPHVAGGERRRGEPHGLPEREVPRHHGEHHAERLVVHPADAARVVDERLGRDDRGPVLGVVPAARRALGHLVPRGLDRLAHLERHEPRELLPPGVEHRRGAPDHGRAFRRGHAAPCDRGPRRAAERALDRGLVVLGKGPDGAPGGGVDGRDRHRRRVRA